MKTKVMFCTMVLLLATFTGSVFGGYEGAYDTFYGINAGVKTTGDHLHTFIGAGAGWDNIGGQANTFIGYYAGRFSVGQYYNTFLGSFAGCNNRDGHGNVFLGYGAGANETGSNKLYIDNSTTSTPLIYGEFDNRILTIYGKLMLDTDSFDAPGWVKLYGAADNDLVGMAFDSFGDGSGLGGGGIFRFARGSQASKAAVQNGDRLGYFVFAGYDGASFLNTAALTAKVDGPVSSGNVPTKFVFETGAAGYPRPERMVISSSGNVGIGTSTPDYPLDMGSGAHVSIGGVWTNASSREYKDNIEALTTEEALGALKELNPVKFAYKNDMTEKHVGFIAEEAPDLIATKDRKGLSSMDIVAVLTRVVQEQQNTISVLTEELKKLKEKVR